MATEKSASHCHCRLRYAPLRLHRATSCQKPPEWLVLSQPFVFHKGGGLLQPRRLRPLNGPIRHPHESSQLELGATIYGNLRDLLTKLTRSPTAKYRKSFGYKYSFPQVSRLQDAYRSHYLRQMHPCSEPA